MSGPIIADNKPIRTQLTKDKEYYFCACGRSARQPFCDGSHKGTGIEPKKFIAAEDGVAWLCCCKHTANAPFCDGTHKQYPDDQVGKA
jgi:methylamine---glutamate N-methyltransferase subunit C